MGDLVLLTFVYPLIGGLILNLMPCVFPMLAIKLMSLVGSSVKDSRDVRLGGLSYTLGVMSCFIVFALAIVGLKAGGKIVGWGFQLQNPLFIFALAQLFFLIGLSFLGTFEFQLPSSVSSLGKLTAREGLLGEFFAGALVGIVSSPCTGPYMAASLGYALSQDNTTILVTFSSLGLGVALPFTLLCFFPSLVKFLPRPGNWMVTLKELCAFPMFLAAIWLVWVLAAQVNRDTLIFTLVGFTALGFWSWLIKNQRHQTTKKSHSIRIFTTVLTAAIFIVGLRVEGIFDKPVNSSAAENQKISGSDLTWQPYSDELVAKLTQEGQPVFVDFTADWCLSCKANEQAVFSSSEVLERLKEKKVNLIKADWTDGNDEILEVLMRFERGGVPLYLMYGPNHRESPLILPQILTPTIFLEYLSKIVE